MRFWPVCVVAAGLIDPLKHDVFIITPKNMEPIIIKHRQTEPSALLFYRNIDSSVMEKIWDPVAKNLKGMIKIGAVDCNEFAKLCEHEGVDLQGEKNYEVMIYPTLPLPSYSYQGKMEASKLTSAIAKLIPRASISVIKDDTNMIAFLASHVALPKVILFAEKEEASITFNALANSFKDRMQFALTISPDLRKRFRVTKTPSLMIKVGDQSISTKGAQIYRGKMKFQDIHDWLNVHSETFVKGGGFISDKEPAPVDLTKTKPWLFEKVPELTKQSHNDLCFKKPKGYCAVFLTNKSTLTDEEISMIQRVQEASSGKKVDFHFSWMDVQTESNYAKVFKTSDQDLPSFVLINPHKRLRFSRMSTEADEKSILAHINNVMDGNARFTAFKGGKLPAFQVRQQIKEEL